MGATQASAGVLAPYIEAHDSGPLLDLTTRSLELFDTFIAGVTTASGLSVNYQRSGTLDVAMQEKTIGRFESTAKLLAARGVEAQLLDREAARDREPRLADDVIARSFDSMSRVRRRR